MAATKMSTLPAVLKQYLPEYEPRPAHDKNRGKPGKQEAKSVCSCRTGPRDEPRARDEPHPCDEPAKGRSHHRKSPQPPSRETSLQRKQKQKKFQKNYEDWEVVKAEHKEETTRHLRSRITIQQELIRKHDELFRQRQLETEEAISKKREAEREVRVQRAEALQQICRQSLEEDRQKAVEERAQLKKKKDGSDIKLDTGVSEPTPRGNTPRKRQGTALSAQSSLTSTRILSMMAAEPSTVVEEDLPPEGAAEEGCMAGDLPWHAEQLYQLYGQEAEYFLKPKMKEEKKRPSWPVNPKLHLQGARASAGFLWTSLRHDSNIKLLQADASISPELKEAYSAFVRQCLARQKRPVKRNFYAEEDVPEMDRLLDQSRIYDAQDYKHMVEVMFRASHMNEDRTGILIHNNPLPNLNNWSGEDSCGRYMPSWIHTEGDEEAQPDYMKRLNQSPRQPAADPPEVISEEAESDQGQGNGGPTKQMGFGSVSLSSKDDQWDFLRTKKDKKGRKETKYLFLTEAETSCEGEFSKRRREALEGRNIPQAYGRFKAQSALGMVGNSTQPGSLFSVDSPYSMPRRHSNMSHRLAGGWQPLSLTALMEYKEDMNAMGNGEFNHGSAPRWSIETAH